MLLVVHHRALNEVQEGDYTGVRRSAGGRREMQQKTP
jgi:hypothetical protein